MASEFKLPELGENIESGTVTSLLVSEGDTVSKDQVLFELETDKAVIELPSEIDGTIKKILIKEGDEVKVGQALFEYDPGSATAEKSTSEAKEEESPQKEETAEQEPKKDSEEEKPEAQSKPGPKKKPASARPTDVKVPELGENIETGTVSGILVKKGDTISKDQALIELETDKAVIEMPSEVSGTITEILISEGDQVNVGQTIMTISGESSDTVSDEEPEPAAEAEDAGLEKTDKAQPAAAPPAEEKPPTDDPSERQKVYEPAKSPKDIAPAAPSVRRFAREIGIDINEVPGTGPGGRISIDDVKQYSKVLNKQRSAQTNVLSGFDAEQLPDFTKWGQVDVKPMSNVRQKTATHLSYAWATIPAVTQFDKADITETEKLRKQYGKRVEEAGGKLTMTAILIKIIQSALERFPQFNSSIDMQKKEILYKNYFNIGIAVDTDRGLLVPVIKDVDKKNIIEIAVELGELAKKARDKKLSLEEMQGGNFSISNLGGIGGTYFTPIINSPEVAILGVSRGKVEPVFIEDEFKPRLMLPLSLTYDHRIIDGADAIRFLRWVIEALEQPFLLSLEG